MTKLSWDSRVYTAGIDRGVLYLGAAAGIAWNGLTEVVERPLVLMDAELYFEGSRTNILQRSEECALGIQAYTYPEEFGPYCGEVVRVGLQERLTFGLSYRESNEDWYRIHLVYNALAEPTSREWSTSSATINPTMFSWSLSMKSMVIAENYLSPHPHIVVPGIWPSSHLIIDSRTAHSAAVLALEDLLYGTAIANPQLPSIQTVVELFETFAEFQVIDNEDGTWTASGPASAFVLLDANEFILDTPAATIIDEDSYILRTW